MTLHNYRSRQVHGSLNGVNPSSGFRDMRSAKSGPNLCQIWQVFGPWASPSGANGQMTMTVHNYRPRQFHRTSNPSRCYRDVPQVWQPPARPPTRPPGQWRQYPSSPEGWGVKRCGRQTDGQTDGLNHSESCLVAANKSLGNTPPLPHRHLPPGVLQTMPEIPNMTSFKVKVASKGGKSTDRDHNRISSEGGQGTWACKISGHSFHGFSGKYPEPPNLTCFTKLK